MSLRFLTAVAARSACRVVAAALALGLAACTGGTFVAEGGIVGTGSAPITVTGAISSFGNNTLVVNGKALATTGAVVRVNQQPGSVADLRVGMVVAVAGTVAAGGAVTATTIDYRADIRGVVDGIDRGSKTFTVLGQTVRTDASAIFDGGTLDTLVSQYVEVSGFRTLPGEVLASLVQISTSAPAGTPAEVTGIVSALDVNARTLRIGTLLVDFVALPGAQLPPQLANGAVVDVRGMTNASGTLVAQTLALVGTTLPGADGTEVEVEGAITEFASAASFKVNGQPVDAHAAAIGNGTAALLGNGVRVDVAGRLAGGIVAATRVDIESVPTIQVDGLVSAVTTAASTLAIGAQTFAVNAATQFDDQSVAAVHDFNLAAVHVGDHVVVTATSAPALAATRVVRVDLAAPPPSQPDTTFEGVISEFNSVADFKVGGRSVNAASAQFSGGTSADLANGRRVTALGKLSGATLLASQVTIEAPTTSPPPPTTLSVEGTITGFVSIASFSVAGQPVNASGASVSGGSATTLANGARVDVAGTLVAGILNAQTVRIETAPTAPTLEVEGTITAFASLANFTLAGQVVDATHASVSNGSAQDIAVGRVAKVTGALVNGVLVATNVQLEDQEDAEVEGVINGYVSVASFVVAGRQVDASAAQFSNGTAANLANGVKVHVRGPLAGAILKATRVEFD